MANPTPALDRIPVWGAWQKIDGTPESGTISFTMSSRLARSDGRIIYPEGATVQVAIGDSSGQDAGIRQAVRTAWRSADQSANRMPDRTGGFDAAAWDSWWANTFVPSAIFTSFPASDDPDIIPQGWQVNVSEQLSGGRGKTYWVQPTLTMLDQQLPGLNLGLVVVPPGSPTAPAPVWAKGQPGGVASLGEDGVVPLDQLPAGMGGTAAPSTGWCDVSTILSDGWTALSAHVKRTGDSVFFMSYGLNGTGASSDNVLTLPSGFAPPVIGGNYASLGTIASNSGQTAYAGLPFWTDGVTTVVRIADHASFDAGDGGRLVTWQTDKSWPTALPGT